MFYAIRRDILEQIGGFSGLEHILADDFAIAQRVRAHGYRLEQTPLLHSISTWVGLPRSYFHLIQRWFTFPRESMLRHLNLKEKTVFYALALLAVFLPWLAIAFPILNPGIWPVTLLYFIYSYLIFTHFNLVYLELPYPRKNS